ncbi:M23 family metallopeptidase [Nitrogeniibacter mangrovi]|uniref:M23 family metallopeptidase n=1 Tax=Nitrogeniibacter mangrovi TaxID=2016596 RepID=A0A6C1B4Q3_9RHOO|nr:M23 family metallopeptidase [Nitrogeniibacter mangrovi]QID18686.1 M23 family metallopeptidase [Nitrogeniibacter mangrovi]
MVDPTQEILADQAPHRPHRHAWLTAGVVGALSLTVLAATAVAPNTPTSTRQTAPVEELLNAATIPIPLDDGTPFIQEDRVRRGDTLDAIFARLGIDDPKAADYMRQSADGQRALAHLRAGKPVFANTTPEGKLLTLSLPQTGNTERFSITRQGDGFQQTTTSDASLEPIVEMRSGEIQHSLFGATEAAGLPDSVATRMADMFGTEIDFHKDLRKGDRFSVVYETLVGEDGRTAGVGRILAAEFVNKGRRHTVVLYRDGDQREDYFTEDGRSLKQAFLRYPLEYTRVTSGFSRRFHPILKKWRAHKGVDFGAPSGAAIKATSNGTVEFIGQQRGYGNVIILRHRDHISTLYGHMRGFAKGLHRGDPVLQGDIIGYVGQTGWATGPHLHYEFRVDNVAKDPMAIALPTVKPLSKRELGQFLEQTAPYRHRLAVLNHRVTASN